VDVEKINADAPSYARNSMSQEELIDKFIFVRQTLVSQLKELDESTYLTVLEIGNSVTRLNDYFENLIERDRHHKRQIDSFLKEKHQETR
jgi:hypothetical protein